MRARMGAARRSGGTSPRVIAVLFVAALACTQVWWRRFLIPSQETQMETPHDPRPIVFCRGCKTDVILLPNGQCPWCETMVKSHRNRDQVERLHRERLQAA